MIPTGTGDLPNRSEKSRSSWPSTAVSPMLSRLISFRWATSKIATSPLDPLETSTSFPSGVNLQRMGNVIWNADVAFPKPPGSWEEAHPNMARKDVTTMYANIWTPSWLHTANVRPPLRPKCRADCTFQDYGFKTYTT